MSGRKKTRQNLTLKRKKLLERINKLNFMIKTLNLNQKYDHIIIDIENRVNNTPFLKRNIHNIYEKEDEELSSIENTILSRYNRKRNIIIALTYFLASIPFILCYIIYIHQMQNSNSLDYKLFYILAGLCIWSFIYLLYMATYKFLMHYAYNYIYHKFTHRERYFKLIINFVILTHMSNAFVSFVYLILGNSPRFISITVYGFFLFIYDFIYQIATSNIITSLTIIAGLLSAIFTTIKWLIETIHKITSLKNKPHKLSAINIKLTKNTP